MEKLMKILSEMHPDINFGVEKHLIDDEILDSLDIVSLIAEISDEFDVAISAKDMVPENFNSVEALYALIQKLEEDD